MVQRRLQGRGHRSGRPTSASRQRGGVAI